MQRTIVIGDIHGCNCTFRQLVFNTIQLGKEDALILLGDYIDRGPDSKGVVETILQLRRDGYDVRPIAGNHEQMLIDAIFADGSDVWLSNGGRATLLSYGVKHPGAIPEAHVEFIRNLPDLLYSDTHIFVHAGLDFRLEQPLTETSTQFKLWSRMGSDAMLKKVGGRKVVTGHTVRDLDEIAESLKGDVIQIDNGCFLGRGYKGKGNLVALELNSNELFVQANIEQF